MELVSLYYFSELAKDLHMTRTAERLYISQQTLSNHIARLESYYGTPLLYRKPAMSLTPAGESGGDTAHGHHLLGAHGIGAGRGTGSGPHRIQKSGPTADGGPHDG